jgi:prolyl oligopeptidase
MLTGANDPRVEPMQSRKMIAKLQAATGSNAPILLRTSDSTGHGQGTPLAELIGETVDAYGFIFDQLGIKFQSSEQ